MEIGPRVEINALKKILQKYAEYCNEGNLRGWLLLWHEKGVQMPPDAPARVGINQIRLGMSPLFENRLEVNIIEVQDVIVNDFYGLTRCRYSLTMTPPGGQPIPAMPDGKALTIYVKPFASHWKIIYDCFNSNLPPP